MDNRRDFIKKATLLTGALGLSSILPPSIQKALAIHPNPGSTYLDAEHVVFLMQENRSFDHTFGTLKGVRGFNDPRAIQLPNGYPVWLQSNLKGETYAPFRLNIKDTKATWMSSLPHSWENQVDARNNGRYDGWLEAKKSGNKAYEQLPLTLGYYNRQDIPFYYALADAFTVCDHNFCSSLTGTSPNRSFFWTGKIKEEQTAAAKPHLSNGDIDGSERISWPTFPERLSAHNVDWRVYQNELSVGVGLKGEEDDWLANFTDNTLEFFKQYHVRRHPEHLAFIKKEIINLKDKAKENPGPKVKQQLENLQQELLFLENNPLEKLTAAQQDLHQRAFTTNKNDPAYHQLDSITYNDNGTERTTTLPAGDVLHQFRTDVDSGKLPTVSWLVPPCNFSDHPGAPWYGAWYLSEVIDILTKNPEVWKKTIFILTYDENDGYFDHIPPFVAPDPKDDSTGLVSKSLTIDAEFVPAGQSERVSPVGLGYRVPMVVVSPWTRGGYVNSQVFDHTSSIQFLEHFLSHKTGKKIHEDNISSWRRSLCGDLSSVFRPYNGEKITHPESIMKVPFIESIHKAKFAKIPDNFKNLPTTAIAEILKNPLINDYLPKQEQGIKPANSIPYEIYADGKLDRTERYFAVHFKAGDQLFGKASSGVGFNVYGGGSNWSFTVDRGDTVAYKWPLKDFKEQRYDVKIYSANGFFRRYQGDANDPAIEATVIYQSRDKQYNGNATLIIKRQASSGELTLKINDNAYGAPSSVIKLSKNQKEAELSIDLKSSHQWYDFSLTSAEHPNFSQQYAGHVELPKESYTDPYMGSL